MDTASEQRVVRIERNQERLVPAAKHFHQRPAAGVRRGDNVREPIVVRITRSDEQAATERAGIGIEGIQQSAVLTDVAKHHAAPTDSGSADEIQDAIPAPGPDANAHAPQEAWPRVPNN